MARARAGNRFIGVFGCCSSSGALEEREKENRRICTKTGSDQSLLSRNQTAILSCTSCQVQCCNQGRRTLTAGLLLSRSHSYQPKLLSRASRVTNFGTDDLRINVPNPRRDLNETILDVPRDSFAVQVSLLDPARLARAAEGSNPREAIHSRMDCMYMYVRE